MDDGALWWSGLQSFVHQLSVQLQQLAQLAEVSFTADSKASIEIVSNRKWITMFGIKRSGLHCDRTHSVMELGQSIQSLSNALSSIDPARPSYIQELTQLIAQHLDVDLYVAFVASQARRGQVFRMELKGNPQIQFHIHTPNRLPLHLLLS